MVTGHLDSHIRIHKQGRPKQERESEREGWRESREERGMLPAISLLHRPTISLLQRTTKWSSCAQPCTAQQPRQPKARVTETTWKQSNHKATASTNQAPPHQSIHLYPAPTPSIAPTPLLLSPPQSTQSSAKSFERSSLRLLHCWLVVCRATRLHSRPSAIR